MAWVRKGSTVLARGNHNNGNSNGMCLLMRLLKHHGARRCTLSKSSHDIITPSPRPAVGTARTLPLSPLQSVLTLIARGLAGPQVLVQRLQCADQRSAGLICPPQR